MTDDLPAPPGTTDHQAAVRRRGWWRTNLVALLSLLVVVPALVYVVIAVPANSRAQSEAAIDLVSYGDSTELGGYSWTLSASREFPGEGLDENDIPTGSSLVAAIIDVAPVEAGSAESDSASSDSASSELAAASCDVTLTSRASGDEKSWRELTNEAVYNYRLDEATTSYCSFDGEAFELEVVFLTPDDAYDSATIDLSLTVGDPTIKRFALQPAQ